MRDASSLIIHYLSYLPSGQTDDSFKISQFLHDTLPQFIDVPTMSEPVTRQRQGVSIGHIFCHSVVSYRIVKGQGFISPVDAER